MSGVFWFWCLLGTLSAYELPELGPSNGRLGHSLPGSKIGLEKVAPGPKMDEWTTPYYQGSRIPSGSVSDAEEGSGALEGTRVSETMVPVTMDDDVIDSWVIRVPTSKMANQDRPEPTNRAEKERPKEPSSRRIDQVEPDNQPADLQVSDGGRFERLWKMARYSYHGTPVLTSGYASVKFMSNY